MTVSSEEKLVGFLESELAAAILDRPRHTPISGYSLSKAISPDITAVNAAFALGVVDRHDIKAGHRLEDLAYAAGRTARNVDIQLSREQFRSVDANPIDEDSLRTFVETIGKYFDAITKDEEGEDVGKGEAAVD